MQAFVKFLIASVGATIGCTLVVMLPYFYDRSRDDLYDWKYEIISQTEKETVLKLGACKHRGLPYREFENVLQADGTVVKRRVRPIAWAITADGHRRQITIRPAEGNKPAVYPKGCADFGKWHFIDHLRQPTDAPIVAFQLGVTLVGQFGDKHEESTPFPIR